MNQCDHDSEHQSRIARVFCMLLICCSKTFKQLEVRPDSVDQFEGEEAHDEGSGTGKLSSIVVRSNDSFLGVF